MKYGPCTSRLLKILSPHFLKVNCIQSIQQLFSIFPCSLQPSQLSHFGAISTTNPVSYVIFIPVLRSVVECTRKGTRAPCPACERTFNIKERVREINTPPNLSVVFRSASRSQPRVDFATTAFLLQLKPDPTTVHNAMGAATSCLTGGSSNEGQPFVRRKVSVSEIARPLTKKLSNLKILTKDSRTASSDEDDVASQEMTPFMNIDAKLAECSDAKGNNTGNVVTEDTSPVTIENVTTSESGVESVSDSESKIEEPVLSIRERISAFEGCKSEPPLFPSGKPLTSAARGYAHDISIVKDKIAKFNALEQLASVDPKAEVKNGLRDPLVVKKSIKFLARLAVFEKASREGATNGSPGKLCIILEPETSSEDGNAIPKNLGSRGSSPRRVADFFSS